MLYGATAIIGDFTTDVHILSRASPRAALEEMAEVATENARNYLIKADQNLYDRELFAISQCLLPNRAAAVGPNFIAFVDKWRYRSNLPKLDETIEEHMKVLVDLLKNYKESTRLELYTEIYLLTKYHNGEICLDPKNTAAISIAVLKMAMEKDWAALPKLIDLILNRINFHFCELKTVHTDSSNKNVVAITQS